MAKKPKPKFEGKIEPLSKCKTFYMVIVEGSHIPPNKQHDDYDEAFAEALRLAKKENKKAFVVQSITEVEMIPNVKQLS